MALIGPAPELMTYRPQRFIPNELPWRFDRGASLSPPVLQLTVSETVQTRLMLVPFIKLNSAVPGNAVVDDVVVSVLLPEALATDFYRR